MLLQAMILQVTGIDWFNLHKLLTIHTESRACKALYIFLIVSALLKTCSEFNGLKSSEDLFPEYRFPVGQIKPSRLRRKTAISCLLASFLTCALTRKMHNDVGMFRRRFREHSFKFSSFKFSSSKICRPLETFS